MQKMSETLIELDLHANPISESVQASIYRESIFEILPNLEVLDGLNKEGVEVDSDEDNEEEEE